MINQMPKILAHKRIYLHPYSDSHPRLHIHTIEKLPPGDATKLNRVRFGGDSLGERFHLRTVKQAHLLRGHRIRTQT